jgi:DNA-binding IclR family transcriptional regulator
MDRSITGVGVLDKAVALLDAVEQRPLSLAELAAATGIHRATAHRLAVALEAHGLLRRDEQGRFLLGRRFSTPKLAELARPALEALRNETGESVQLYVRRGRRRLCVASLESPQELRTIVPVGTVLPLERGSGGTVLRELPEALRRGWAESVAERAPGVASVSAPIYEAQSVIAAISVSGPIERMSSTPGSRFADAVVRAARAVERALRSTA